MEKGAGYKAVIFLIILGIIIVGGFVLMQESNRKLKNPTTKKTTEKVEEIRIDPNKDYIYFEDKEVKVDELDIYFENVVLNFKETTGIEKSLNEENASLKETLKYDDSLEDTSYNKLSSAKYATYEVYNYDKYISLVVKYYNFDRENLVTYKDSKAYVFNKDTAHLYTDEELLKAFEIDEKTMKEMIKDTVDGENLLREDEELDSTATLENIKDPSIYVDKIGRLTVSVLVKSNKIDYNEDVILN